MLSIKCHPWEFIWPMTRMIDQLLIILSTFLDFWRGESTDFPWFLNHSFPFSHLTRRIGKRSTFVPLIKKMAQKNLNNRECGGFGKLMVSTLPSKGHQGLQPCGHWRQKQDRRQELRNAGAKIIELDVTSDQSVARGKTTAELNGLDVLVNNAGVGTLGMQEFLQLMTIKSFDVNVFGVQRMNRAVAPYFREKKRDLLYTLQVYSAELHCHFMVRTNPQNGLWKPWQETIV